MNQILQVGQNKYKNKSNTAKDMLIFLIIFFVIFGLIIGGYKLYQEIANGNIKLPGGIGTPKYTPNITLTQTDNNKLVIYIESETEIANIKYNWNDEYANSLNVTGINNIEKTIDIPIGENIIHVSVTDINGNQAEKQDKFILDVSKPLIDLAVVGNYIKITVISETELSEITYSWNSENEKKENMLTYENRNSYEKKLEIPLGKNTLKIVATDINGTKTEKTQEIKGITKATTTTEVKEGYWHFTVTGSENIETVQFKFNGKKYIMNTDTFGQTNKVHYKVKLKEGTNYLEITTKTQSGGEDTTTWTQEY